MKVRDVQSMNLTDIRSEIELIEAEARRMAPSEAEFRRRFPTMAGRLQTLIEQRGRLESGGGSADEPPDPPPPKVERPAPRVVGPTRRPATFLDLREELLDGETTEPRPGGSSASNRGGAEAQAGKELAVRDAEIRRLREERDDWKGKAEGAESRLVRGAEMGRRLEEALAEVEALRERLADAEHTALARESETDTSAELMAEVDQLRIEQDTMQAAHHQELEQLRDRHRQEIETFLNQESERRGLEERISALDAEIVEARADAQRARDALDDSLARAREELGTEAARYEEKLTELGDELATAHRQRSADLERVEADLAAVRAANVGSNAERERLTSQLEAATLDRSVVSIGILQVVQGLAGRIQEDPRFAALSGGDPALEDVRRRLFQDLERFSADARGIGTDMGPEAFLHALAERLDTVPNWIGDLVEALGQLATTSSEALAARDRELEAVRAEADSAARRAASIGAELEQLRATLDAAATKAREDAEAAALRIGEVEAELGAARDQLGELETQRLDAETRYRSAEDRAQRDAAEVQRLEETLEGSERHVAELENELTSSRAALASDKARIDEISIGLESERLRASEADRQVLHLENELAETRTRVTSLQSTIEQATELLGSTLRPT